MFKRFIQSASQYASGENPFAVATIVHRTIPTSGKPGDRIIIDQEGNMEGWIGGGCTKGIILKEGLAAIHDGKPRLVNITPDAQKTSEGVINYTMTCQSGGAVQVYIEPVLPMPKIHILGKTHIARALAKVANVIGYQVTMIGQKIMDDQYPEATDFVELADYDPEKTHPNTFIVVSTQGDGDEVSLMKALKTDCTYIAFVASRKKANAIFTTLRDMGATFDQLKKIKTPAGLDIQAKTPEEVAISILAEIIQRKRSEPKEHTNSSETVLANEDYYVNPVCNIPIQKSSAKHILEYQNEKVYFCCDGCKVKFEKDPAAYME